MKNREIFVQLGKQHYKDSVKMEKYSIALERMKDGLYSDAITYFKALGDFKDSTAKIEECNTAISQKKYNEALELMNQGKYTEAISAFEKLGDFSDCKAKIEECKENIEKNNQSLYLDAIELMNQSKYEESIAAFEELRDFRDSKAKIEECKQAMYNSAITLVSQSKYDEAISVFESLGTYRDSKIKVLETNKAKTYSEALDLMNQGKYDEAINIFLDLGTYSDCRAKVTECTKKKLKNIKVGDYIKLGTYDQDNYSPNKEFIEWLVLDKKEGKALVISRYALFSANYNNVETDVTWETCSLRQRLNSDFLSTAFTTDEKAMISTVIVSDNRSSNYSINPGNATKDQVFLLSVTEVEKYFKSASSRICQPTASAQEDTIAKGNNCYWWLRSASTYQKAYYVNDAGRIYPDDVNYYNYTLDPYYHILHIAVRPAMWINIE